MDFAGESIINKTIKNYHEKKCTVFLSISSSGYATCTAEMSLYENISADMTVTLYKSKDKSSWTPVQTWDVDRSILPSFEGGCRVSSGYYYVAELSANTYNRYGSFVEDVSLTSTIRQY